MLKTFFGKIIGLFALTLSILSIAFLALNVFFNWKNYQYNDAKLKILRNKDEFKEAERESRQSELEKKQIEQIERQLAGFQPDTMDTEPLEWPETGYSGIKGIDEAKNTKENGGEPELIYTEEQKKHFIRIIEDIDDFLNSGKVNPDIEGERNKTDQYRSYLLRNNCILYGAPGTGKTKFVEELNHVLINRYGRDSPERPQVTSLDPNDPNYGFTQDNEELKPEPVVPIFVIRGATLFSTGTQGDPKTFDKFIITLKKAKNDFFKNPDSEGNIGEDSKLPYIVFVDEADQAKNPLTYSPQAKNNLEEFKNFFLVAKDGGGIGKGSQDLNSICIFATNNYETVDPAIKRRGRLGVSINFTWNPNTFWKYIESRNEEVRSEEKINWPTDDPNWKFGENEDYPELFKEAEKMNFDNFKDKFFPKTKEILELWNKWDKKEREDFARSKLGLSNRRWCSTCYEEVEPEKLSAKSQRIREAIKDIKEYDERMKIRREEEEKELCCKSHETEPFANWLLHYLHTFFYYYERQDLESFDKPQKIMRYSFDDKKLLRERIRLLEREINEGNTEMINTFGGELRSVSLQMEKMSELSSEKLDNLNSILENLYQRLKDYCDSRS